jgi:hypothetical protein
MLVEKMKKLIFLLPLVFLPAPVMAQQVNQFGVCTQYQEVYVRGGYDQYGNYYPGGVQTQSYNVPCNQVSGGNWNPTYQRQRVCNPTAGAAMGAGLAEALSGGNGYKYNSNYTRNRSSGSYNYSYRNYKSNGWSLFGAGLGALMYSC